MYWPDHYFVEPPEYYMTEPPEDLIDIEEVWTEYDLAYESV